MRQVLALVMMFAGSSAILGGQAPASGKNPLVIEELNHDLSAPLRDIAIPVRPRALTPATTRVPLPTRGPLTSLQPDPVAQEATASLLPATVMLNFDGQNADGVVPPDTNGAVGNTQFVQWVNLEYNIYEKGTGEKILGPVQGNSFWQGFGGACETHNDGDIIIQYDKAARRWLAAQPVFSPPFMYCLAVSTTPDATGTYNRYAFSFPDKDFPDYPKVGVWPDGYYASFNIFRPRFAGAMACAYDRIKMLQGQPATAVCFQEPPDIFSLLPSDLDGHHPPPDGSPNFFMTLADSSHLSLFQFHVDFANPQNSSFTGPAVIPVAPFSEICNRSISLACIPEPKPGEKVDGISDRLMYRLAYRNFGDYEALVANHTVSGGALAGVRWYEIRSPGFEPFVFQQGTVVDPVNDFWMGSIAMDNNGDIALGFSASSRSLDPSVLVVGRVPGDPPGTMESPITAVLGTGVQKSSSHRWGDYSSMAIDPDDDCTFWYTQEYYKTTGAFNWSTRITSFRFDSCK